MSVTAPRLDTPRMRRLRYMTRWMDEAFRIPGTRYRIGLDSILGLVPGAGDLLTAFVSAYLIREAYLIGAPRPLLRRMAFNALLDWLVGTVPIAGDVFDIAWKANKKNLRLLERWLAETASARFP